MQPQMVVAVILAALGPLVVRKHIFSDTEFSTYVTAAVAFAFSYGVPFCATIWVWWKTRRANLIRATAQLPGVAHVAMDTHEGAYEIAEPGDKIFSPGQVRRAVADSAAVEKIVVKSDVTADHDDHPKIVGPPT